MKKITIFKKKSNQSILIIILCVLVCFFFFQNRPNTNSQIDYSTDYTDYTSMAKLLNRYNIKFGTVINAQSMNQKNYKQLVKYHFNSLTAANEMKAYSMLSQSESQKSKDGMPVMNYTTADRIMQFAADNNIGVRGHVLVWDAYMSDWFFREGYQSNNAYVDRETMLKRVEYYITEVITHFETSFPGVIYCWDVVNEAVGDNSEEYNLLDVRHLRTLRSGTKNLFYEVIGDDYVELSFLYARNAVTKLGVDVKLFYNDYNTFQEEKCSAICELIKSVNTYQKEANGRYLKLCDGVGMQGYIGGYGEQEGCLESADIYRIQKAVGAYGALNVEVHITESAVRNYDKTEVSIKKHAKFYENLFDALIKNNQKNNGPITSISIWGLCDNESYAKGSYNYNLNSPYGGLFTQDYKVKEAFAKVNKLLSR